MEGIKTMTKTQSMEWFEGAVAVYVMPEWAREFTSIDTSDKLEVVYILPEAFKRHHVVSRASGCGVFHVAVKFRKPNKKHR
jgi:hypothetical protein